jgi:hypothetical protein
MSNAEGAIFKPDARFGRACQHSRVFGRSPNFGQKREPAMNQGVRKLIRLTVVVSSALAIVPAIAGAWTTSKPAQAESLDATWPQQGGSDTPRAPAARIRVLTNETFDGSTSIEAAKVVLSSGGRVRVRKGTTLTIQTAELEIQGAFVFDGRGDPGTAGTTPTDFTTSGPCSTGIVGPGAVAHRDWENAGGHPNDRGGDGGPGDNGGVILVHYKIIRYVGTNARPGPPEFLTKGGGGGAAGRGRKLICGCHPEHVKFGPNGTPGADGADGRFVLQQQ